ncbi:translation initiation factor IF-2 [Poronia punctata]|nr:translation initiation factor IF-2 [Poronia punctata]
MLRGISAKGGNSICSLCRYRLSLRGPLALQTRHLSSRSRVITGVPGSLRGAGCNGDPSSSPIIAPDRARGLSTSAKLRQSDDNSNRPKGPPVILPPKAGLDPPKGPSRPTFQFRRNPGNDLLNMHEAKAREQLLARIEKEKPKSDPQIVRDPRVKARSDPDNTIRRMWLPEVNIKRVTRTVSDQNRTKGQPYLARSLDLSSPRPEPSKLDLSSRGGDGTPSAPVSLGTTSVDKRPPTESSSNTATTNSGAKSEAAAGVKNQFLTIRKVTHAPREGLEWGQLSRRSPNKIQPGTVYPEWQNTERPPRNTGFNRRDNEIRPQSRDTDYDGVEKEMRMQVRDTGHNQMSSNTSHSDWGLPDRSSNSPAGEGRPAPIEDEVTNRQPERKAYIDRGPKDKKFGKRRRRSYGGEEDEYDASKLEQMEEKRREKEMRKAQREAERAEPRRIILPELISITAFANALKIRPDDFLVQLAEFGFEDVTIDSLMAGETAALVAQEYGFEPLVLTGEGQDLQPRPPPEDLSAVPPRPPVVTIMGHVDHGKTTILDYLRHSSVAAQEHGGITQHIGAFSVKLSSGKPITFLDTPGHAAFLTMRQRGANVTDIVVLVVAADDSVKPQTLEAIKHARAAKVPIIVAINKIDKDGARVDAVKHDLAKAGVEIEDFGGDVQVVCVSGKTGQGMDDLEESILTLSEILDHRAEVDGPAEGWILESSLKPTGKVATVLVKRGTLRTGDFIAAGITWAKVRQLRNEAGADIEEAPPGTPVEVFGWKELPAAGDQMLQADDEDRAKTAVSYREGLRDREKDAAEYEVIAEVRRAIQEKRAREKAEGGESKPTDRGTGVQEVLPDEENGTKRVNFIVKADVHGSVEAVCAAIQEVGNHEVSPRVLRSATGPISEFDVEHAAMSKAVIVNFSTTTPNQIKALAEQNHVRILDHTVIYHLVDDVKSILSTYLAPDVSTRVLGEAEILQIFPINLRGRVYKNIAGCRVRNGVVAKHALYRVIRGGSTVFEGKLETMKHGKKDVMEMRKGTECGLGFGEFQDIRVGDQIQAYEEVVNQRTL